MTFFSEQTLILLLTAFSLLDLMLTAVKAAYSNARIEKLLAQGRREAGRAQAASLLSRRAGLIFQLQTSHVLTRFAIAGAAAGLVLSSGASFTALLAVLLASGLILALLEQGIESLVLPEPEKWAARLASFTRTTLLLLSPLLLLPRLAARLLPAQPNRYFRVTEDELNLILDAGQREGVLEVDEREMISSIFSFRDTSVREIMIPRIDMLSLSVDTPLLDAIDSMLDSGFSRVPVYAKSIDDILGVLYIKDLLRLYRDGKQDSSLRDHLRQAQFVPETKKAGELLAEMQARHNHLAIVVDEYGGVAGIATLEDIVEEIVGEIQDEYDQAEEVLFQQDGDGEYVVLAKIDIDDFNQAMEVELPKDSADTLGGLLYSWFGRIPSAGETAAIDDILFTVDQVSDRRIRRVRARRLETSGSGRAQTEDTARYWQKHDATES